eukprot:evm.model.scf_2251.2 EVM.evm.TU.scf_2251.2   scf_2251:11448-12026(+)
MAPNVFFCAQSHYCAKLLGFAGSIPPLVAATAAVGAAAVGAAAAIATAPPIQPAENTGAFSVTPLPPPTLATAAVVAALSNSILAGDVAGAAQVLIDSGDIAGLVLGLQIPPGIDPSPGGDRNSNGDVVAIKAVALAALTAAGLESKLTEVVFRASVLPSQEGLWAGGRCFPADMAKCCAVQPNISGEVFRN